MILAIVSFSLIPGIFVIEFANLFHMCSRFLDDAVAAPTEGKIMLVQAAGGMVAGATASCVTTPLDTIKTRLQAFSYAIFDFNSHFLVESYCSTNIGGGLVVN